MMKAYDFAEAKIVFLSYEQLLTWSQTLGLYIKLKLLKIAIRVEISRLQRREKYF
jgi:hypothetical protein